jgi:phosphohistidine phosphatase
MDVWLLRHAAAEDAASSGRDADRKLTAEGAARASAVARGLAKMAPGIEAILSSPYRRAKETAEPAAKEFGLKVTESRVLEPGHSPSEVLKQLAASSWERVLLVGHEPLLGSIVGLAVFGDEERGIPLKKAQVAHVRWNAGEAGKLKALIPAKVLERPAES